MLYTYDIRMYMYICVDIYIYIYVYIYIYTYMYMWDLMIPSGNDCDSLLLKMTIYRVDDS